MSVLGLWRKEDKNAELFVDLFEPQERELLQMHFMMTKLDNGTHPKEKNAMQSVVRRKMGNQKFKNGDYSKAISYFNQSLCLAPAYTEHVGIAYANRCACFLKLKMYEECLADIQLAKEENYPIMKVHKLYRREAECIKHIVNQRQRKIIDIGLKLSYDSDETYPSVANVLSIEEDGKDNFIATAKEDIGVGKTIIIERAFATYSTMGHSFRCNICLKTNTNLVACKKCTVALFCDEKCRNNTLHEGECGLAFSGKRDNDAIVLKEVRIILIVVDMFDDVDELMYFVQETVACDSTDLYDSVEKSRYRNFLKLPFSQADPNSKHFVSNLYYMYKLALEVPKVSRYFSTEKLQRFLMHLLCLHYQITEDNSEWSQCFFKFDGEMKSIKTHCIMGVRNKLVNLSCAPNVMSCDRNDMFAFITIRPIKKGEQLLTYIHDYLLLECKTTRQKMHWEKRNSACTCSRCEGLSATSTQQQEIKSDPDFNIVSSRQQRGTDDIQAHEKFVNFLNRYGHIPWCDEIGKVVDSYVNFLRDNMSGQAFSTDKIAAAAIVNELL